jgi:hypothetical protein
MYFIDGENPLMLHQRHVAQQVCGMEPTPITSHSIESACPIDKDKKQEKTKRLGRLFYSFWFTLYSVYIVIISISQEGRGVASNNSQQQQHDIMQ